MNSKLKLWLASSVLIICLVLVALGKDGFITSTGTLAAGYLMGKAI